MNDNRLNVPAQRIGDNFSGDPELTLPDYPYFPPEILMMPYAGKGLLFEGVKGRQVIMGRSALTFIPQLLAKLDGSHSLDQLCQCFPAAPRKAIHDALALLYSRGLLESGKAAQPAEHLRELAAFAGRYNDVTRINRNRGEALGRLGATRVAIARTPGHDYLWHALTNQNLASLKIVDTPAGLDANTDILLAVLVGNEESASKWLTAATCLNIRTLHAHVGEDCAEIGPLFVPGKSACYNCFRTLRPAPRGEHPKDVAFWASVVALNALHLISRIGTMSLYNTSRVHRNTPNGKVFDEVKCARLPGCSVCGLEGRRPQLHEPDGQVWLLHNNCDALPYDDLKNPRDHQRHYAAANVQITGQLPKPFYGAQMIELPAIGSLAAAPAWEQIPAAKAGLSIADLATALRLAAGYQTLPGEVRHIAPHGGGLAAANLFVIARQVQGLEPGVYHYFGYQHTLERVASAPDELLEGALGVSLGKLPSAVIVGTALMVKLRKKYDNFSIRLSNLDAGVAKGCLYEALGAMGVPHVEYVDARDKVLAHILHIPVAGNRSIITFTLGLGDLNTAEKMSDLTMYHYHYPDSLIEMGGQLGVQRPLPQPRQIKHNGRGTAHIKRSLEDIMLARRSLREYAKRAISPELLNSILALGSDADQACVDAGGLALKLNFWVVSTIPGKLPVGVYGWDQEANALQLRRQDYPLALLEGTMSQKGFSRAPIVLFISADFEHAITHYGARGYREMLNRAGTMMVRVLLAAEAHGIGGCMWGGITEEMLGQLLNVDRYRDCPVFGGSLGYAQDE
jgi:SagB-type dehydrogenase family enzyme